MSQWWNALLDSWEWSDPMLVLGILTIAVTALIPVFVWRLGAKQTTLDSKRQARQVEVLERQERISRRQRRDALLSTIEGASDTTHLTLLFAEVAEFQLPDKELLLSVFRSNEAVALPGTSQGVKVSDVLDSRAIKDYTLGLERRYSKVGANVWPYEGLSIFMKVARSRSLTIDTNAIVDLITGDTVDIQSPGHMFYRELVNIFPEIAVQLIYRVEKMDYRIMGGVRLNVLTGALLGAVDIESGRSDRRMEDDSLEEFRHSLATALATLLHRDNLRTFNNWTTSGSTEPVSATVAWLIRVVGWLADADGHLAMRMVQNLSSAISSIPNEDRGWGIDSKHVQEGFDWIELKQPRLWEHYGEAMEKAASEVGRWRSQVEE
ncbi:hypothetical protein [Brevibacterium aurantiacum]|uniref:hypothetical protein n=1 Tax=Brevibacterium aurantiacum TaxID=273384 RepID=UPI001867684E|nr:hypothetical protein [Brevibacterium aurantiacum]